MNCIKCGWPTDVDIDSYVPLHDHCAEAAGAAATVRHNMIAEGRTDVLNMTKEEREKVLAIRRDQRAAITD